MMTTEMLRMIREGKFSRPADYKSRKNRRVDRQTVSAIHRLVDDGHDDMVIAERLGVSRHTVAYRRRKVADIVKTATT